MINKKNTIVLCSAIISATLFLFLFFESKHSERLQPDSSAPLKKEVVYSNPTNNNGLISSAMQNPMRIKSKLLESSTTQILAQETYSLNSLGKFQRVSILHTDFKYPYIRVVETFTTDPDSGEERLLSSSEMVADHLMVKIKPEVTVDDLKHALQAYDLSIRKHMYSPNVYLVALNSHDLSAVPDAIDCLSALSPLLETTEPDYLLYGSSLFPNDPRMNESWGLHNQSDTDIDAPEAWNIQHDASNVVIAVIDSGIDYQHEDLADNMWRNPGEIADNGIDDDNNGAIDDVVGWDFCNDDNDPMDDFFHGTHCAGIIGAVGNNNIGSAGVCWKTQLMAIKFLNDEGIGATSDASDGIYYAMLSGAKLTSNSWGGGDFSEILRTAIITSGHSNMLFIAAVGNDGQNVDIQTNYPSGYSCSNIISVAATHESDELAIFSNYGTNTVDLAAPGAGVYSTFPENTYRKLTGTSMAAPFVAGACALMWEQYPLLPYETVKQRILESGDRLESLRRQTATSRRLNIYKALVGLNQPENLTAEFNGWTPLSLTLSWNDRSDLEELYRIERRSSSAGWTIIAELPADSEEFVDSTNLTIQTRYEYRVSAVNSLDLSSASVAITIPLEKDQWDPDDDTISLATIWPTAQPDFSHGPHTLSTTMDPSDYFSVSLQKDQAFYFEATSPSNEIAFRLYGPDQQPCFPSVYETGGRFLFKYTAHTNGNFYIQAFPWESETAQYTFEGSLVTNSSPSIVIQSPLTGSTLECPIPVVLQSSDPDGEIERTDVYVDHELVASVIPPFNETVVDHLSNGEYSFMAITYDDYGASSTSVIQTITVTNAPVRHYVNTLSTNPVSPYVTRETAAHTIQDAVDVAAEGAIVEVASGIYDQGGRNNARIMIDKPITLLSSSGPETTIIKGNPDPNTGDFGPLAFKCIIAEFPPFYNTNKLMITGFTLKEGYAHEGSAAVERAIDNVVLKNCIITECAGNRCIDACSLQNCLIYSNNTYASVVTHSDLKNCVLFDNTTVYIYRSAACEDSSIRSCTIVNNQSLGIANCSLVINSIIVNNLRNHMLSSMDYTCTSPMPTSGDGNISVDPMLTGTTSFPYSPSPFSPCVNKGKNELWMYSATDAYHQSRIKGSVVDMGAIEYQKGLQQTLPAALSLFISGPTNLLPNDVYTYTCSLHMEDDCTNDVTLSSSWSFTADDLQGLSLSKNLLTVDQYISSTSLVMNAVYDFFGTSMSAVYEVGIQPLSQNPVLFVDSQSTNPVYPYATWTTAATNIQDAVDASAPENMIIVADGVYSSGGKHGARVFIDKSLTIESVNGPESTVIEGLSDPLAPDNIICVLLQEEHHNWRTMKISGFTIRNGKLPVYDNDISGVRGNTYFKPYLENCVLSNNMGGAITYAFLNRCLITHNTGISASGAGNSYLTNCIIAYNLDEPGAPRGAGAFECAVDNCTIVYNQCIGVRGILLDFESFPFGEYGTKNSIVAHNDINFSEERISHSFTSPMPAGGTGNSTNIPTFENAAQNDFRLTATSSGINAGINDPWMTEAVDYSGNPRIVFGQVDAGALEFIHSPTDYDGDNMSNTDEIIAGCDPTIESSCLVAQLTADTSSNVLEWDMQPDRVYSIWVSDDLFEDFSLLADDVESPFYADTYITQGNEAFFQIRVRER